MAQIVIIGAGLTGLSAAYHLEKAGFFDYVLLEREQEVGGLCRSIQQDGFTFDYTGHLLHLTDPYIKTLINTIIESQALALIQRRSYIYSHGVHTAYPFQINLHGLPAPVIVECLEQFITRPHTTEPPASFREWVRHSFGEGLGKHFFYPYQQKIFDIAIEELSASWTGRFVPSTSLHDILNGALGILKKDVGYNAQFLYPQKQGMSLLPNMLHQALIKPAKTGYQVRSIDGQRAVIRCTNGHEEPFSAIISTMPLTHLLAALKESPATTVAPAQKYLRCNSVINLNIGLNRSQIHDGHWVYYPELQYPFYRIGFPTNLTPTMAPTAMSSLSGECSVLNGSEETVRGRTEQTRKSIHSLFSIDPSEIKTEAVLNIPHAYVIFDHWRDTHLPPLLHTLADTYNIHSTGRYGGWKYSSMQDALIDGKEAAEHALSSLTKTPLFIPPQATVQGYV